MINKFVLSFILVLGVSFAAYSFEVPPLTGPVMDEVGVLKRPENLAQSIRAFKQQTGVQLQVYVTKSLNNEDIAPVALQIFDKWQLGDEKTDRGLLFLIAPNEKRMRIEVGQGLEGDIPDVIAKRIISDVVRPYFQNGQFEIGIYQGVSTIQNYIVAQDPSQIKEVKVAEKAKSKKGNFWIILIVIGLWILLFIFNPSLALYILFSAMRGGGGGGGGGGGWSGGGGRSSGGGASGSW